MGRTVGTMTSAAKPKSESKRTVGTMTIRSSVANTVSTGTSTQPVTYPNNVISYGWWIIALVPTVLLVLALMVETDHRIPQPGDCSHIEWFENLFGFSHNYWWKWHHMHMT